MQLRVAALLTVGCGSASQPPRPEPASPVPVMTEVIARVKAMETIDPRHGQPAELADWDEAFAAIRERLGEPTAVEQTLHVWSVPHGDACSYVALVRYDEAKVDRILGPTTATQALPADYYFCMRNTGAAPASFEDATVTDPPAQGMTSVEYFLTGMSAARSRWLGKRVTIEGVIDGYSFVYNVDVEVPDAPLVVDADPDRLLQVVSNLLVNAAKYTEPGGHVWLSLASEGDHAELRVRDDGIGIPAELLPHVFDLFVQAERDSNRSEGGLGIGLSLVKRLVEMHGGTVEAASDGPGRGCELVVRLPLAASVAG